MTSLSHTVYTSPPKITVMPSSFSTSLRNMAVLSSRAQERRSHENSHAKRARTSEKNKNQVAPAPISSRFLCPRPPLLLSSPNQNRHATQATSLLSKCRHVESFLDSTISMRASDLRLRRHYPQEKSLQGTFSMSLRS